MKTLVNHDRLDGPSTDVHVMIMDKIVLNQNNQCHEHDVLDGERRMDGIVHDTGLRIFPNNSPTFPYLAR